MSIGSPLVSILIPAYNAAPYLAELCRSIQAQTYENLEVLIGNDGSSDNTLEVLIPFQNDSRFRIITWEKNRGVSQATHALFGLAKGEFWCHPGADDVLTPLFIQERLNRLAVNPRAVMVHGAAVTINERGEPAEDPQFRIDFPPELKSERALSVLLQHNIVQTPSIMVRMSLTKSILPFLRCDWRYAQDWYFWILHLATGFDLLWDPKALHKYRIHSGSLSTDPSKAAIRKAEIRLVPLCALKAASEFSCPASQCFVRWRRKMYCLWLRRAWRMARDGTLKQEWLDLGANAYYPTQRKAVSLSAEISRHFVAILLSSWHERQALRNQKIHVSGIAQVHDPLFR